MAASFDTILGVSTGFEVIASKKRVLWADLVGVLLEAAARSPSVEKKQHEYICLHKLPGASTQLEPQDQVSHIAGRHT